MSLFVVLFCRKIQGPIAAGIISASDAVSQELCSKNNIQVSSGVNLSSVRYKVCLFSI